MKLGIMQPYFFPYIGYFDLIFQTDQWVVFDVVQYNARSWMNRNRIHHPTHGTQYISAPVRHADHGTPIGEVRLADKATAVSRIVGQLSHYRQHAPHYTSVIELVHEAFASSDGDRLVDLNIAGLRGVCRYLDIPFRWTLCSDLKIDFSNIEHPGQWALKIAKHLDASEYLNPPGGRALFRREEWSAESIALKFTNLPKIHYDCRPYEFLEHLSILDVLMWVSPESVRAYMRTAACSSPSVANNP